MLLAKQPFRSREMLSAGTLAVHQNLSLEQIDLLRDAEQRARDRMALPYRPAMPTPIGELMPYVTHRILRYRRREAVSQ
jgi:hypothetical protein